MSGGRRVLVTGASGRVGSQTVDELTSAGYDVVAFDAVPPATRARGVRYLTGALEEFHDAESLGDLAAVVHLAARMLGEGPDDADAMMATNVMGTYRVLDAVCRAGFRGRFVFASSGQVYPELAPQYLPLDEHHPRRPANYYGMTKLLGEDLVEFFQRRYQMDTVILRFAHVQDPSELLDPDSTFSGPRFFLEPRIRRERSLGNGDIADQLAKLSDGSEQIIAVHREDGRPSRMGVLSSRDMAIAVRLALESSRAVGQTIGVNPDEAIDLADFARRLAHAAGLPVVDVTLPAQVTLNYWTVNNLARELLGFRPSISYDDMVELAARARKERQSS